MPGSSPTMARREPTRRLNSVDFPTLGRPTIAMVGMPAAAAADGELKVGWVIRLGRRQIWRLTLHRPYLAQIVYERVSDPCRPSAARQFSARQLPCGYATNRRSPDGPETRPNTTITDQLSGSVYYSDCRALHTPAPRRYEETRCLEI